ncbi:MAG TPA: hypothetical protein VEU32_04770 [Burkholderiales bacterium]|nr:hypothetical protein [Burkholderiales bacterium]
MGQRTDTPAAGAQHRATIDHDIFSLAESGAPATRQALSRFELLQRVSALMQSCEGCEELRVVGVTRLEAPDTKGCNWAFNLVLDTTGVPPEVYGLAYASVIGVARASWNLQ